MRSIFSLLFIGMVFITSLRGDIVNLDRYDAKLISSEKDFKKESLSSLQLAFGYAIVPAKPHSEVPLNQQVQFKELTVSSKNVSLSNGSLELPSGVYRLSYGVDLQNVGKSGTIITWLTIQNSHLEPPAIIPYSIEGVSISAACEHGFSIVQVSGGVDFDIIETSLISLNYLTVGDVRLSILPSFESCNRTSKEDGLPPNPFHLSAVQF